MLTSADVSLQERRAHLRHTKNGSQRVLPLTGSVVAALRPFYEADAKHFKQVGQRLIFRSDLRPDQPRYFELVWHEALAAAGITGFKFHDCRHTAASYLARHGASLLELADFLGHRQLEMVRRYAHLTVDSKERLVARVLGRVDERACGAGAYPAALEAVHGVPAQCSRRPAGSAMASSAFLRANRRGFRCRGFRRHAGAPAFALVRTARGSLRL